MIEVTTWQWFNLIRPVMELHYGPMKLFQTPPAFGFPGCPDGLYRFRGRTVNVFAEFVWAIAPR